MDSDIRPGATRGIMVMGEEGELLEDEYVH